VRAEIHHLTEALLLYSLAQSHKQACRRRGPTHMISPVRMRASFFLTLLLLLAACQSGAGPNARTVMPGQSSAVDLRGSYWQLIEIRSMNDYVYTPLTVERYTLDFLSSGQLLIRADCNRGEGVWVQQGNRLEIGEVSMTRAMCRPESIDQRFLSDLNYVRSFVLQDDRLYLATMADGAILEFEPRPAPFGLGRL